MNGRGPWRALLICVLLLAGCAESVRLGLAPNVYSNIDFYPEAQVPDHLRTVRPTLYHFTDRAPTAQSFSHERSDSMVFGRVQVEFGSGLTWPQLLEQSVRNRTGRTAALTVGMPDDLVRLPASPLPLDNSGDEVRVLDTALDELRSRSDEIRAMIAAELARANRREAVVFVHGFRNDFEDGHATLANIWHFSGRIGVPILFSWPAGNPGLFAYFKDRESGEFSVFHFKQFITLLASIPELDKIHIVAHSRGADVTTSGLRELIIAERAAGRDPARTLKIENLILAAPDIDFGVVRQRLVAERFGPAFGQITVYLNQRDPALGLAQTLMSGVRMGRLSLDDLDGELRETFSRIGNVNFVDVERPGSSISHSYFRDNPAVVSDIVLTIRTGAPPGGAERPLAPIGGNFWRLNQSYPDPRRIAELWAGGQRDDDR